jgi:hypothetical protein
MNTPVLPALVRVFLAETHHYDHAQQCAVANFVSAISSFFDQVLRKFHGFRKDSARYILQSSNAFDPCT